MKEEKQIQHVIGFSVSDIEELPIGPARYIRLFKVRNLLGDEFVLELRSESRLGLTLENERNGPIIPKPRVRRRNDMDRGKPDN